MKTDFLGGLGVNLGIPMQRSIWSDCEINDLILKVLHLKMFSPSEEVKRNQLDMSFCNPKKKTGIGNNLEDIGIEL